MEEEMFNSERILCIRQNMLTPKLGLDDITSWIDPADQPS